MDLNYIIFGYRFKNSGTRLNKQKKINIEGHIEVNPKILMGKPVINPD